MSKSHDSLHLRQSMPKTTTTSKVLRLPRNQYIDLNPLRSPVPVTKSRLWTTNSTTNK